MSGGPGPGAGEEQLPSAGRVSPSAARPEPSLHFWTAAASRGVRETGAGGGVQAGECGEALPAALQLVTRRPVRGFFSHLPRDAFSGFRSEGRSESGAVM